MFSLMFFERGKFGRGLRNLAEQIPIVIPPHIVTSLMNEFSLVIAESVNAAPAELLDDFWLIFQLRLADGTGKYPLLCIFMKDFLNLSHRNADVGKDLLNMDT